MYPIFAEHYVLHLSDPAPRDAEAVVTALERMSPVMPQGGTITGEAAAQAHWAVRTVMRTGRAHPDWAGEASYLRRIAEAMHARPSLLSALSGHPPLSELRSVVPAFVTVRTTDDLAVLASLARVVLEFEARYEPF